MHHSLAHGLIKLSCASRPTWECCGCMYGRASIVSLGCKTPHRGFGLSHERLRCSSHTDWVGCDPPQPRILFYLTPWGPILSWQRSSVFPCCFLETGFACVHRILYVLHASCNNCIYNNGHFTLIGGRLYFSDSLSIHPLLHLLSQHTQCR